MSENKRLPAGFCDPRDLAGLPADAPLCVGLSGGADSVALLSLLAGTGTVQAVHVHHGIRGAEADRDANFCRRITEQLQVPLTVLHIDAPALAKTRGISLETAAREGRYEIITAHMKATGIPLLVTAHHAGDQLETMLQHLLRGSGLGGLCGIPACRPLGDGLFVARPLLTVPKTALLAHLAASGLDFVEDSTNAEACCTRNRLRLEVIPVLEELYGNGTQNAARTAALLCEDEVYLQAQAAQFLQAEGREPRLDALAALPRPIFARVMQKLLPAPPEQVHIAALAAFCQKNANGAVLCLPGGRVMAHRGKLMRLSADVPTADFELPLLPGENSIPETGAVAILCAKGENCLPLCENLHTYATCVSLSSAMIKGGLSVRNRRAGDKILHQGMHKAVRRLPVDLPAAVRARMPLLADDNGILAVPFAQPHGKGGPLLRDDAYESATHADITVYLYFD